ncbi:unnamed protein product [Discosporangium mesarthrocarpum]
MLKDQQAVSLHHSHFVLSTPSCIPWGIILYSGTGSSSDMFDSFISRRFCLFSHLCWCVLEQLFRRFLEWCFFFVEIAEHIRKPRKDLHGSLWDILCHAHLSSRQHRGRGHCNRRWMAVCSAFTVPSIQ